MSAIFAVVGPSGAGKDTLIDAAVARQPDLVRARRVITRPEIAGGEDFEGVDPAEFDRRLARGDFALAWLAHGLRYGVPATIDARIAAGDRVVFNASRAGLDAAADRYPDLAVIHVTAPVAVLADRLAARGRETRDAIAARLGRAGFPLPMGLDIRTVVNDGDLETGATRFLAALQPVSG